MYLAEKFQPFRYFGLLPSLEILPTAFVARGRRNESLKGRNANRSQEIFFNPAATAEELHIQIDKFIAAPPAGFSYPRGSAKA